MLMKICSPRWEDWEAVHTGVQEGSAVGVGAQKLPPPAPTCCSQTHEGPKAKRMGVASLLESGVHASCGPVMLNHS